MSWEPLTCCPLECAKWLSSLREIRRGSPLDILLTLRPNNLQDKKKILKIENKKISIFHRIIPDKPLLIVLVFLSLPLIKSLDSEMFLNHLLLEFFSIEVHLFYMFPNIFLGFIVVHVTSVLFI